MPPEVFLDHIHNPSIRAPNEVDIAIRPAPDSIMVVAVHAAPDWTAPYLAYLENGTLPPDKVLARQIVRRAKGYTIINNELYKRGQSGVFMRCVSHEEGYRILLDIHAGDCGHHAGTRLIVAKAYRHGFYWLTAYADTTDIVKRCVGCQKFVHQSHLPASALKTIPLTRPFAI